MLLDNFDPKRRLWVDVETISWDDKRGGLLPYHGDRVAGFSICDETERSIYVPIRHRTDQAACVPLDIALTELSNFAPLCTRIENVNIKFDLHCLAQDGIEFKSARLGDTGTLARIVNNTFMEYNLEFLAQTYNKKYLKLGDEIEHWLTAHNTKDYGAIPLDLISRYARNDTLAAMELTLELEKRIKDVSKPVWDRECQFTRVLFNSERYGVKLDPLFFMQVQSALLKKMGALQDEMTKRVGYEFNPKSHTQVAAYFEAIGIKPVKWNEQKDGSKSPSWDGEALSQIIDPTGVGNMILDYGELNTALTTYAVSWLEKMDKDHRLRPSFNQSGTKTGRISSSKPNMQNPPKWAMRGILIPDGKIGVKFDYSQIEYRIFAHFAQDQELLDAYKKDPKIDFHQLLANRFGMPQFRDAIKTLNFGILYGMGKKKCIRTLAKTIHDVRAKTGTAEEVAAKKKKLTVEEYEKLLKYLQDKYGDGTGNASLETIATNILEEYHKMVPAIKLLLERVKRAIHAKGYIKNFYGRHFQFDLDRAYVALNYLCQGTAADLFKDRVCAIFEDSAVIASGAEMVTNIHDAVLADVPIEHAQVYWDRVQALATEVVGFRVPILIDGEVAVENWSKIRKIKNNDVMSSVAICYFEDSKDAKAA